MKIVRTLICTGMVLFLLFTPAALVAGAQESFVDARFVRKTEPYRGSILLYHIVRHRPYSGSMTQWLRSRAEAYEKKHKGLFIEIEGMNEKTFSERLEHGRRPDGYSFFSGSVYRDRLAEIEDMDLPLKDGLFVTDRCVPYCYSGYTKLVKTPDGTEEKAFYANDVLAALNNAGPDDATEDKADVLYLDLRRAGDLVRYKDGFSLSAFQPIGNFTDAVCWMAIDRETDSEKAIAILGFLTFLLEPESQNTLNALGMFGVRRDIRNVPPEAGLKQVFKAYETVKTVDPFLWNTAYDSLAEDARKARSGDPDAKNRFTNRLHECCS